MGPLKNKTSKRLIICLTAAMLLGILFFGLRPTDFSLSNKVTWISHQTGIHFGKYSIAHTDSNLSSSGSGFQPTDSGISVEMALRSDAANDERFKFLVVLHNGDDSKQFLIGQWRSFIILMNGDDYNGKQGIKKLGIGEALLPMKTRFVSITSGEEGTEVYIDGQLAAKKKDLSLKIPEGKGKNRLVVGNSVYGRHSWEGDIYGLAIYGYRLTEKDIAFHFERWTKERNFRFLIEETPKVLYIFEEKRGAIAFDKSGGDYHLKIPSKMKLLKRKILEWSWHDIEFSRSNVQDMIINFIGFIPLGFLLSILFTNIGGSIEKHAFLIAVSLCFIISLIIEIAQSWIPSRSSSMLDLFLNMFGALLGALCFRFYLTFSAKGRENLEL
jgi:hypothetical protein